MYTEIRRMAMLQNFFFDYCLNYNLIVFGVN